MKSKCYEMIAMIRSSAIDSMYCHITSSIKSAYCKCSRVVSTNTVRKNKSWWSKELNIIKSSMLVLKYKSVQSILDKQEFKRLQKCFKDLVKRNIYLYERNEFYKIGNLIKAKSGVQFFKNVNTFLGKNNNCDLGINTVLHHYDSIFNEPLDIDAYTINEVNAGIFDIKHENFEEIDVNLVELKYAFISTNISKVVGDDSLSSYMLLNISPKFHRFNHLIILSIYIQIRCNS
jgi:hypothetical protein